MRSPSDPLAPLPLLKERAKLAGLNRTVTNGPDTSPLLGLREAIEASLAALTDPPTEAPSAAETSP